MYLCSYFVVTHIICTYGSLCIYYSIQENQMVSLCNSVIILCTALYGATYVFVFGVYVTMYVLRMYAYMCV